MSSPRRPLVIVPGRTGQHARVVFEAAVLSGWDVAGIIVSAGETPDVFGCERLGEDGLLDDAGFLSGVAVIPATGGNSTRLEVAARVERSGGTLASIVHPAATISPSAVVAPGCVILAGAILGTGASLGSVCIVNHAASVGHDCTLAAGVNVCSGARLAGSVRVGEGAFIGLNASVIQGVSLGERVTVGAGAVVVRDVAAEATVAGVPARSIRQPVHRALRTAAPGS